MFSIEGNTLTIPQITAILDNKRVAAPKKDILEVKDAITTYNSIQKFKATNLGSFLKAHQMLMAGLVPSAVVAFKNIRHYSTISAKLISKSLVIIS